MSYVNFRPEVFANLLLTDLSKALIFGNNVTKNYEGKIKQAGETIKFRVLGELPTYDLDYSKEADKLKFEGKNGGITRGDKLESSIIEMQVNKIVYYDYAINDIDEALTNKEANIMAESRKIINDQVKDKIDRFIAKFAVDPKAIKVFEETQIATVNNIMDIIDEARTVMSENDIPKSTSIVVEVPPRIATLLRKSEILTKSNNNGNMPSTAIGDYNGFEFHESNNVYSTKENDKRVYHIMFRTKRAICYAAPLAKSEAYRPEGGFVDAVKGYVLYDAKVIRPKELFTVKMIADNSVGKIYSMKQVTE